VGSKAIYSSLNIEAYFVKMHKTEQKCVVVFYKRKLNNRN
jgi:hypothetical protein